MVKTELTLEEKRRFVGDGYIVLRDVVPRELTYRARREINMHAAESGITRPYHDFHATALPDVLNKSPLNDIMRNTMGPFDPPRSAFAATLYPQRTPETARPNFGWQPHIDGLWAGGSLPATPEEVDSWQAPRTAHFGNADARELGANRTPFFHDPDCRVSLGSFTAFVGVALNDQSEFGRGNLCLLPGAHETVENFFQMQRDAGGVVGPEGPGWPRLSPVGNNGVKLTSMPPSIRDMYLDDAETTDDGQVWLKPSTILLQEGDAVVVLHACPHGSSVNLDADPRMNVYFRLRHERPGGVVVLGDSDHPDRGWDGEFLEYPEGYDPWHTAINAMCDHWSEWDGMQDVVAEERRQSSRREWPD